VVVQEYYLKENISRSLLDKITGMQCGHGRALGRDHCYVITYFSKIPSASYIRDQDFKFHFHFLALEMVSEHEYTFFLNRCQEHMSRERSFPTLL
jgi:hypothetical protein